MSSLDPLNPCSVLPRGPLDISELFWSKNENLLHPILSDSALAPYIALMESTIEGRNLGKYDFIAIADAIDKMIDGERNIRHNGLNQCKIICEVREDANLLILSKDLRLARYNLFISTFLIKKGLYYGDGVRLLSEGVCGAFGLGIE